MLLQKCKSLRQKLLIYIFDTPNKETTYKYEDVKLIKDIDTTNSRRNVIFITVQTFHKATGQATQWRDYA